MLLNAVFVVALAFNGDDVFLQSKLQKDTEDPVTIVHEKEPGNGYVKGDTYNPNNPDEPLSEAAAASSGEIPPVSTTMKCVINLAVQYFLVYTALAIARTYAEFSGNPIKDTVTMLVAATGSVAYAPMLSVLFLGVRMRALQLTQGKPDEYDLPQPWVKMAMQSCAWAVLIQTIMVLAMPLVLGSPPTVKEDGTPEVPQSPGIMAKVFSGVRWVAMLMLYGGFTTVCVGGIMMEGPKEIWGEEGPPKVSPAVGCTMNLAVQYFLVYLVIALIQTYEQLSGPTLASKKWGAIWAMGANTVNFAPMLAILFIGARMRALQLDPKTGNPQAWAQNCFYMCTYSLQLQLLLVILVPGLLGGKCVQGDSEGDITFEVGNPNLFWVLTVVRYVLMLALYGGFTAVIVSVNLIEAPGGAPTPPVSPAMQCVMNLTVQYFFVYLLLWIFLTLKQLSITSLKPFLTTMIPTMEAAKGSVMFCPMLAVLFIGLRLRALQITDQKGAPQGWAQQGMFAATYAVLAQVLLIMILPAFMGPMKVDQDGNPQPSAEKPPPPVLGYILAVWRYIALICVYGGAVTVVVALFKITPETATGSGSLIPGVEIPTPPPIPGQAGSF